MFFISFRLQTEAKAFPFQQHDTGYRQPDAKAFCKSIYLMHLKSVKSPKLVQGCLRKKKAKRLESCGDMDLIFNLLT